MGILNELKSFFKHPIEYLIIHSYSYKDLQQHTKEVEEDNCFLQEEVDEKNRRLSEIKYDVENALETCMNVRTGYDVVVQRAKGNEPANTALSDWLDGPKGNLEKRVKDAEYKSSVFEGFAFGSRVNLFINQNPKAKKISIGFYDFANKEFYYNSQTAKLLGIESGEAYKSLGELLRIIKNEEFRPEPKKKSLRMAFGRIKLVAKEVQKPEETKPISKRKYLLHALKKGELLDGFEIYTVNDSGKESKIYLTTRPVQYISKKGDVKYRESFGILMFFNGPSIFKFNRVAKEHKIAKEVLERLKGEFEVIYEAVGRKPK